MKQQSLVLTRIRDMILQGRLAPGQKVSEAFLADQLGLSRTPVRQALPVLANEGLLVEQGARGYAVRAFTFREVMEAVELRGVLEGLAARKVAERGTPRGLVRDLRDCLLEGDAIFAGRHLVEDDASAYGAMNGRLHRLIVEAADSTFIADALARINAVPFADPSVIAFDRLSLQEMYDDLFYAHRQHHEIVNALEQDEGARAEALLREHVHAQKHSMNLTREDIAGAVTSDTIVSLRR